MKVATLCVCVGGGGGGGRGECPLPPVPLLRDTQIFYRHTHTELILLSLGHIQASRDTKQERMTKRHRVWSLKFVLSTII